MVAIPAAIETTTVATVETVAAPAKKEKAPRVRKAAAPKAKEEKAPTAPSKNGTAPKAKKEEKAIRKPQLRMLVVLSKLKRAISLRELAEKADVNYGGCTILIGSLNEQKRKENDARYFPSLVSLGLVKVEYHESNKSEGKQDVRYTISAKGKEAIQKTK